MYQVPMDDDFQQMLVSALRYALTRNSYIVGLTIEYIERKIPLMDKKYLSIMSRDIDEENWLRIPETLDRCWTQLQEKIDERLKEVQA